MKPTITITIQGGLVQDIDWPDELKGLFRVVVADYDEPDIDSPEYREDHNGYGYIESAWEDPKAEA